MQRNPGLDAIFAHFIYQNAPAIAVDLQQLEKAEKNQSQNIEKQNQFNHQRLFNQQPKHQIKESHHTNNNPRYHR